MADVLTEGQKLGKGDSLTSSNGAYTLTLQDDGNLVLVARGDAVWASGTNGQGVVRAEVQTDGNFVLYTADKPVWHTDTKGKKGVKLVLQDDRNLVLYAADGPAWSSKTETDAPPPHPMPEEAMPSLVRTVEISPKMISSHETSKVRMSPNDLLRVELPEAPSTGFVWTVKTLPSNLAQVQRPAATDADEGPIAYGGAIRKVFEFAVSAVTPPVVDYITFNESTEETLVFELKRRWQTDRPPRAVQAIEVTVLPRAPAAFAETEASSPPHTYTVVSGDTLWAIAERFYGDGNRYHAIAEASGIPNPDLIRPGQILEIP